MEKRDIDLIVSQLRNIILGRPITDEMRCKSEELEELQEGLDYLKASLVDTELFFLEISKGNLDALTPTRVNGMNGSLKELQASLKHLSWQADQVAKGDYSQAVSFLGDFSESFNTMVKQLAERENQLKQQSNMLADSVEMFKSVMNGLQAWMFVLDSETKELVFMNEAAKSVIDIDVAKNKYKNLYGYIKNYEYDHSKTNYICHDDDYVFQIKSYFIRWNNQFANVHYIVDITEQSKQDEYMKMIAYKDVLTNLYNRRYVTESLERRLENKETISLCLLDLDGLKYANDNFGHAAGDNYLKAVTNVLKKEFSGDIIARIGGDEFAIISKMPALELTSRIDRARDRLIAKSTEYPMCFSYGIVYVKSNFESYTCKSILVEADEKMYIHKKENKKVRD